MRRLLLTLPLAIILVIAATICGSYGIEQLKKHRQLPEEITTHSIFPIEDNGTITVEDISDNILDDLMANIDILIADHRPKI